MNPSSLYHNVCAAIACSVQVLVEFFSNHPSFPDLSFQMIQRCHLCIYSSFFSSLSLSLSSSSLSPSTISLSSCCRDLSFPVSISFLRRSQPVIDLGPYMIMQLRSTIRACTYKTRKLFCVCLKHPCDETYCLTFSHEICFQKSSRVSSFHGYLHLLHFLGRLCRRRQRRRC
jgi:hypothetical protein